MRKINIHYSELSEIAFRLGKDLNKWGNTEFIFFVVIPKAQELGINPLWTNSIYEDICIKSLNPTSYIQILLGKVLIKLKEPK